MPALPPVYYQQHTLHGWCCPLVPAEPSGKSPERAVFFPLLALNGVPGVAPLVDLVCVRDTVSAQARDSTRLPLETSGFPEGLGFGRGCGPL